MRSFKNCSPSFEIIQREGPLSEALSCLLEGCFFSFVNSFFTRSVAVLPSYAPGRSLKSADCLLLSKRKMQTNGLVSHWIFFLLLLSRLLWTSRCPEKGSGKKTFSAATLFSHILSLLSSLASFHLFSSYHTKQIIKSKWLRVDSSFWVGEWGGALIWHSKWNFTQ